MVNKKLVKITRFLTMTSTVDYESYRNLSAEGEDHPRQMTEDEIIEYEMNIESDEFIDRILVEFENEPTHLDIATQVRFEEFNGETL